MQTEEVVHPAMLSLPNVNLACKWTWSFTLIYKFSVNPLHIWKYQRKIYIWCKNPWYLLFASYKVFFGKPLNMLFMIYHCLLIILPLYKFIVWLAWDWLGDCTEWCNSTSKSVCFWSLTQRRLKHIDSNQSPIVLFAVFNSKAGLDVWCYSRTDK